jgi:hypothetical protein
MNKGKPIKTSGELLLTAPAHDLNSHHSRKDFNDANRTTRSTSRQRRQHTHPHSTCPVLVGQLRMPTVVVPVPPVREPQPEPEPVPVAQINIAIHMEGAKDRITVDDQPVFETV